MLEIGCGIGIESKIFSPFVKTYIATDIDSNAIKVANDNKHSLYDNLTFIVDDVVETKLDSTYDIILSINTIHLTKTSITINKLLNMLNKNGTIIITEPIISPYNWGNDELNINSPNFNKDKFQYKKQLLENEHMYLMFLPEIKDNITISYTENTTYRLYMIYI